MIWLVFLLPLVFVVACKNPYVVDARGVDVETTGNYHESYDNSDTDDYLSKPMVKEVDVCGVDTTAPDDKDHVWLDRPDSYDKELFRSPAMSVMDEATVDGESEAESRDFDAP